ncbi:MAG: pseudouridine synthase [Leptospiraceae bacterium]|nr:pseudouridine synthase [Leptospiraceae bacterium]MDW8305620.1 pseudouridine synthase [Leptospiraceae bacterium]
MKNPNPRDLRIGQFLSRCGLCSRREAADFLRKHKVIFEGKQIQELNFRISEDATILVDGKPTKVMHQEIVVLFNKPPGYICSHNEQRGKKSMFRLLPKTYKSLFFAGRLDEMSRGLVILSGDGDLIYSLSHPSHEIEKEYIVRLSRPIDERERQKLLQGIYCQNEKLFAHRVETIHPTCYRIVLTQGKNRQIRRMFARLGVDIKDLERTRIGSFELGDLSQGQYRVIAHKKPA